MADKLVTETGDTILTEAGTDWLVLEGQARRATTSTRITRSTRPANVSTGRR